MNQETKLKSIDKEEKILGVFTSAGVTGYKGIRVTFCNVFKWRKVTLIPLYPVTPVLVNTPIDLAK